MVRSLFSKAKLLASLMTLVVVRAEVDTVDSEVTLDVFHQVLIIVPRWLSAGLVGAIVTCHFRLDAFASCFRRECNCI